VLVEEGATGACQEQRPYAAEPVLPGGAERLEAGIPGQPPAGHVVGGGEGERLEHARIGGLAVAVSERVSDAPQPRANGAVVAVPEANLEERQAEHRLAVATAAVRLQVVMVAAVLALKAGPRGGNVARERSRVIGCRGRREGGEQSQEHGRCGQRSGQGTRRWIRTRPRSRSPGNAAERPGVNAMGVVPGRSMN
jgi:hypothetical protein